MEKGGVIQAIIAGVGMAISALWGNWSGRKQERAKIQKTEAEALKIEAEADSMSVESANNALSMMRLINDQLHDELNNMRKRFEIISGKVDTLERKVFQLEQERGQLHEEKAQLHQTIEILRKENESLRNK